MRITYFLHGLDSSGRGTKGQYFANHYPDVHCPDFTGTLRQRMVQLERLVLKQNNLILIGSSFGGLMATCFAVSHPAKVQRLILLAPALNFTEYSPPDKKIVIPTTLFIGKDDQVTPPSLVLPLAEKTFRNLAVHLLEDDHLLHTHFPLLDWPNLLQKNKSS